jgi:hypothetical protein
VHVVRLADERDDRRPRIEQRAQIRVGFGVAAGAPRRAEGGEPRVLQIERLRADEELGVLRVAPRPAAFDVLDAQLIEPARDLQLVLNGERQPLHLGAIAERRVVQLYGHGGCLLRVPVSPGRADGSGRSIERSTDGR